MGVDHPTSCYPQLGLSNTVRVEPHNISNRCFGKGGEQTWISRAPMLPPKNLRSSAQARRFELLLHMVGSGEHGQLCVR
jgi:hypothetical protein